MRMKTLIFTTALFACGAISSSFAATGKINCAFGNAKYTIPGETEYELSFRRMPTEDPRYELVAELRRTSTNQRWRFETTATNGYMSEYLVPKFPGLEEQLKVFFFDKNDEVSTLSLVWMPSRTDPAPIGIFIPDLGSSMYYASGLDDGIANGDRLIIPTEMWILSSCSRN